MSIIRKILGALILFFDRVFAPKGVQREAAVQARIDKQTATLSLYQYAACPFCVKVRRTMKRHSLHIETRDAKRCPTRRDELINGGGQLKVPCLRIEDDKGGVRWMYESSDIIEYLQTRFVDKPHNQAA